MEVRGQLCVVSSLLAPLNEFWASSSGCQVCMASHLTCWTTLPGPCPTSQHSTYHSLSFCTGQVLWYCSSIPGPQTWPGMLLEALLHVHPLCQFYFKCRCQLLTRSVTTAAPLAFLSDLCWAVLNPLGCFLNCFRNKRIHSWWSTVCLWTRNNPSEKMARHGSYLVCSSCVVTVLSHCPQSLAEAGM